MDVVANTQIFEPAPKIDEVTLIYTHIASNARSKRRQEFCTEPRMNQEPENNLKRHIQSDLDV